MSKNVKPLLAACGDLSPELQRPIFLTDVGMGFGMGTHIRPYFNFAANLPTVTRDQAEMTLPQASPCFRGQKVKLLGQHGRTPAPPQLPYRLLETLVTSANEVMFSWEFVCLSAGLCKILNRFSKNGRKGGRNHLVANPDHVTLRLALCGGRVRPLVTVTVYSYR